MNEIKITPTTINFHKNNILNFDTFLSHFNWKIQNSIIDFDFSKATENSHQGITLYILYMMYLEKNGNHIKIQFPEKKETSKFSITKIWKEIGGDRWRDVLTDPKGNFRFQKTKPLITIRNYDDVHKARVRVDDVMQDINIEYEKSLKYILAELLYNTVEHSFSEYNIPSLLQFNLSSNKRELSFIIADTGIGIKKHLSKVHSFADDVEAIQKAIKPKVSGTFYDSNPYKAKNNAGVGLFISSNIARRLYANMYIVSGNGLVHISPTDITQKRLENAWKGTFIYLTVNLGKGTILDLDQVMSELRIEANKEYESTQEKANEHYLLLTNFFGKMCEDKGAAISYRDNHLVPACKENKDIILDFDGVIQAPHSFLNGLLSSVIDEYGLKSYKKIKIRNASTNIREALDFILDDHTR